ncbi:lasso peptide biosynthesis PqqD family chaperone [Priestia endophytica]|uniref:lasso peptide biosynthesis PqqD family chaperone n=1 Tax=Priestia endophytica TaxID=135735 RepID=UPI00124EC4C9|nr:lasso peptide biosynthesis PqqD family chaperone [Priestia endophytica]KAB2494506.1 lasso peptide biosynthesis PqqD family chaperone [Priestia endophytica]
MSTLSLKHHVVQGEGNIASDMDQEKVMLNIENGKYYNLGNIGGAIWDEISEAISVEELVEKLLDKYDVQREQCENHVLSFLSHLQNENLIKVM